MVKRGKRKADYFSLLPESLIHSILSLLPLKEIGRTCVLSKHWNGIWCNYPNLDFRLDRVDENSLDQCLARIVRRCFIQELCVGTLADYYYMTTLIPKLDSWLVLALGKGLSNLVIKIDGAFERGSDEIPYSVPQQVLVARTLKVLDLQGCALEKDRFDHIELPYLERLSLSNCFLIGDNLLQHIVKAIPRVEHLSISYPDGTDIVSNLFLKAKGFVHYSVSEKVLVARSLKVLNLVACTIEEDRSVCIELPCLEKLSLSQCHFKGNRLLQRIIQASPKIEDILVYGCSGVGRSLSISGTSLLKYLSLRYIKEFERIKINAPSLHTFAYASYQSVGSVIDVTNCRDLKELTLWGIHNEDLQQLLSIVLDIQVLNLANYLSDKYTISSKSLQRLVLLPSDQFPGIEIDAPNLLSIEFEVFSARWSDIKFTSWIVPKLVDIHMKFTAFGFRQACCWAGLEDFLMKLHNYHDVKLLIYEKSPTYLFVQNVVVIEELHAISLSSIQSYEYAFESRKQFLISSRSEENLVELLSQQFRFCCRGTYMICYSHQCAEIFYKKLRSCSSVQSNYRLLELLSPHRLMKRKYVSSFLKPFVEKHSSRDIKNYAVIVMHPRTPCR